MSHARVSRLSSIFGAFFGWVWIAATVSGIGLIGWAIFGEGVWYYPLAAFALGAFCKSLCRQYMNQAKSSAYMSTGIDYAKEWIDLPEESKYEIINEHIESFIRKYHRQNEHNATSTRDTNTLKEFADSITRGYKETGLCKPYQEVCSEFIENYFFAVAQK